MWYVLALIMASAFGFAQSDWQAPVPRQAKPLFAPRPFGGDNILKGDAEKWLADLAIEDPTPVNEAWLVDYVSQVGNHLARHSQGSSRKYEFIVLDDGEANAMTAGAGRIYINRGMLEEIESEDELAAVLAHEIAHDAFEHTPKTVTRQLFWMTGIRTIRTPAELEAALDKLYDEYETKPLLFVGEDLLGFRRSQEIEADRAAFDNLYKAGYNPNALETLFKRFERSAREHQGKSFTRDQFLTVLLGSHPPIALRVFGVSWESIFVKMPQKEQRYRSAAFDTMKARLSLPPLPVR